MWGWVFWKLPPHRLAMPRPPLVWRPVSVQSLLRWGHLPESFWGLVLRGLPSVSGIQVYGLHQAWRVAGHRFSPDVGGSGTVASHPAHATLSLSLHFPSLHPLWLHRMHYFRPSNVCSWMHSVTLFPHNSSFTKSQNPKKKKPKILCLNFGFKCHFEEGPEDSVIKFILNLVPGAHPQ